MRHETARTQPAARTPRPRARDLADFCPQCLRVSHPRPRITTKDHILAVLVGQRPSLTPTVRR